VILYLDTSALVKRYISELGTAEVNAAIQMAVMATFDRQLWQAARTCGLNYFPEDLTAMLAAG
jgi:predicted nucleic acid-binding protein